MLTFELMTGYIRERFTRPVPTNAFELLEYCYDFNEYFIELCNRILCMSENATPNEDEYRNNWINKRNELQREQRRLIHQILENLIDNPSPLRLSESEINERIEEYKNCLTTLDNLVLFSHDKDLVNILHLSSRNHSRDRRNHVWLCIHFGEGNRNIEYPRIRDNRIFNLSYHFYIKNVRLRITLQGATLGIYHLSPWQYINGNDTGRWNVRTPPFLSGSDCSFEFQENDKLFGKCFNKKLGFLTQCESSYSVRCATALYNGEDSFYIEKVIINGVTYWVDDVKKRGALMQELDSLLVQIKNLFFNNLRSGSNSNGFNDFAYAEVQYAE